MLTGAAQGGNPITLGTPYFTQAGGIIVFYETGTITYDPARQGAVPTSDLFDVFTYTITDVDGDSDTGFTTITVANNNLVPLARPVTITVTAGGGVVTGNVRANDDLGDPPTQVTSRRENGTLIPVGQDVTTANGGTFSIGRFGLYSYTPPDSVPAGGFVEEIKYVIQDSDGEFSFSDLTITVLDGSGA